MDYKQQLCREHNGYFSIPVKRGRPPVKCSPDNVCDAIAGRVRKTNRVVTKENTPTAAEKRRSHPQAARNTVQKRRAQDQSPTVPSRAQRLATKVSASTGVEVKAVRGSATVATPAVVSNNPSVRFAFEAKRILEPLGWQCSGRAWNEPSETEDGPGDLQFYASLIGKRGDETITFLWRNGKLASQDYIMWHTDKPSDNGMPRKRLNFDPEGMSDAALIKRISGCKVFWWNPLAKSVQSAVFPHASGSKVKVEHLMNGNGDNEKRIVSFVDQTANHAAFRAFYVDALIKVSD